MKDDEFQTLLSVSGGVSRETFDRLKVLETTLRRWNGRINLIGPSTESEIWSRHILDSAQLQKIAPQANRWLDLGSGGGFPGLVIAIMIKGRADHHIDLVESNRKKAGFLQLIVGQLGLPAHVHAVRIETLNKRETDIVTARAFAPLPTLLETCEFWLSRGTRGLFHKGRDYAREIAETAHTWSFDLIEHASAIDADGVILEISNLRRL